MSQKFVKLDHVEIFILDEADRMLDMGFINDVKKVVARIPDRRQTLFFSATMPTEIKKLASSLLTNPKVVEVTPVSSTAEKIEQSVYFVTKNNKKILLCELILGKKAKSTLVFTRTKHGADKVVKDLAAGGINAMAIHGNKSQNARQRALNGFKEGTIAVLVATDIAARGIDVDGLALVINYDLPNESETYVHRIGRTGRAGASGVSVSFCDAQERGYLRDIERLIGKKIPVVTDHEYVDASPEQKPEPQGRQRRDPGAGRGEFRAPRGNGSDSMVDRKRTPRDRGFASRTERSADILERASSGAPAPSPSYAPRAPRPSRPSGPGYNPSARPSRGPAGGGRGGYGGGRSGGGAARGR